MQDGYDVFGVHGLYAPLCLSPLQPQDVVGESQHHPQLAPLPLLGLGHLGHLQLLPRQSLQKLLQDLPVVEVLLHVLHNDPVGVQLVVHPVQKDLKKESERL